MAMIGNMLTVPKYESNGSVAPIALGGALDILTSGGWVENKGSTPIHLVRIGDNAAKSDPVNNGIQIVQNGKEYLNAGMNLSEMGLLAENVTGAAFVFAK